jgi:hypothetical protein
MLLFPRSALLLRAAALVGFTSLSLYVGDREFGAILKDHPSNVAKMEGSTNSVHCDSE